MPRDGSKTRTRILNEATQLVLENGFAGTTIDNILGRTQITKGAFFYHFKNKGDLAKSLMQHFAASDLGELEKALEQTGQYAGDPRQRLLQFVQWFIDIFSKLETPHAGCLYASYVYEPEQFSQEIKDMVADAIIAWREAIVHLLDLASRTTTPQIGYNAESLADLFSVILEGAFIVSKALDDPQLTANQLIHYKNYLELIFEK